jgi:hypothetical protein
VPFGLTHARGHRPAPRRQLRTTGSTSFRSEIDRVDVGATGDTVHLLESTSTARWRSAYDVLVVATGAR